MIPEEIKREVDELNSKLSYSIDNKDLDSIISSILLIKETTGKFSRSDPKEYMLMLYRTGEILQRIEKELPENLEYLISKVKNDE